MNLAEWKHSGLSRTEYYGFILAGVIGSTVGWFYLLVTGRFFWAVIWLIAWYYAYPYLAATAWTLFDLVRGRLRSGV